MRKATGMALMAVGALVAVLGLAIIVLLGPDGRLTTGPHSIDTDGIAVITAPTVIRWKNVRVELLAEVPANKPVFVGVGNSVDVQAYLKGVRRLEVTSFSTPWRVRTRQIPGRDALPGAPTAVDWWRAHAAGLGGATIKTELPDETVSAAILSVGASNLRGLKVTLAYGLRGAIFKGLGLLLGGLGLVWAGLLVRRGESMWVPDFGPGPTDPAWPGDDEAPTVVVPGPRPRRPPHVERVDPASRDDHEDHEVMYVYVDENGVEHEISAHEAAGYEVIDVEHVEHLPHGQGEPFETTEIERANPEPVTYFWVDDDGVEHEVSADELHEFELFDEDDS